MRSLLQVSPANVKDALSELQGLTTSIVTGAAAGTKMNIAALRDEDTILSVIVHTDAGGAQVDDRANVTIQSCKAFGTVTISGNPSAGDTVTINGDVFTFRTSTATLAGPREVLVVAGDNTAMALALSNAINAWQTRYETYNVAGGTPGQAPRVAELVASPAAGVVTINSVKEGVGNAPSVANSANGAVGNNNTASVTLTCVSMVNGNTFTFTKPTGGTVVFTIRTTATVGVLTDIQLAGSDILQAAAVSAAINAYENQYGTLDVVASVVGTNVVTLVPKSPKYGNIISLAKSGANLAVSGAAATGGTLTGGIKSTINLAGKTLTVQWYNLR